MIVERIDHVHIEVADREISAQWYQKVLGLQRFTPLQAWADDPMGPLILCGGDGEPALSLFARPSADPSRDATVAFRVSGPAFIEFCDALPVLGLVGRTGVIVSRGDVVDHDVSWSLYFVDRDKNRIEVTTYDYDVVLANAA